MADTAKTSVSPYIIHTVACNAHISSSQKTIFVGGFSDRTDAQTVLNAFAPFGDIIDVALPPDPARRKSYATSSSSSVSGTQEPDL